MPNRCLYIATIKEFLEQERQAVSGTLNNNYHGEVLTTPKIPHVCQSFMMGRISI